MAAQRLSIWGALRQISSMNAKNTASRKGDWWVASFSPPPKLLQLPEEIPTTASRKGVAPSASPELPVKTLAPFHLFLFSPRRGRNGKQILHRTLWQTVPEKLDRLVHGVPWIHEARLCYPYRKVLCTKSSNTGVVFPSSVGGLDHSALCSEKPVSAAALTVVVLGEQEQRTGSLRTAHVGISPCNIYHALPAHVIFLLRNWKPFLLLLYQ